MATQPVPQQPGPPLVVIQAERNGLGTSSLILGFLSTFFGIVPFGVILALPCAFVGVGLGLGNIGRLRRHAATNKIVTGLGIVLSVLGIVLSVIFIRFVIHNM